MIRIKVDVGTGPIGEHLYRGRVSSLLEVEVDFDYLEAEAVGSVPRVVTEVPEVELHDVVVGLLKHPEAEQVEDSGLEDCIGRVSVVPGPMIITLRIRDVRDYRTGDLNRELELNRSAYHFEASVPVGRNGKVEVARALQVIKGNGYGYLSILRG